MNFLSNPETIHGTDTDPIPGREKFDPSSKALYHSEPWIPVQPHDTHTWRIGSRWMVQWLGSAPFISHQVRPFGRGTT